MISIANELLVPTIAAACMAAAMRPWLGVVLYYAMAIGRPEGLWPALFQDYRISLYVSLATIAGLLVAAWRGQIGPANLLHPQPLLLVLLCALVNAAHWLSPIDLHQVPASDMTPGEFVAVFNKLIVFYLIAAVAIDSWQKLRYLWLTLATISILYACWANAQFLFYSTGLSENSQRLNGPKGALHDENVFALMFVLGVPAVYYLALGSRWLWQKALLLMTLPLLWHALFLTSSRGGLAALAAVIFYCVARHRNKPHTLALAAGLCITFAYLGGNLLERLQDTRDSYHNLGHFDAVDPRLVLWETGIEVFNQYPLLGIGPNRFHALSQDYDQLYDLVTHNTLLQLLTSAGFAAGIIYLLLFAMPLRQFIRQSRQPAQPPDNHWHSSCADMINAALLGLFVAAVFLDLMLFEPLYFLLLLHLAHSNLVNRRTSRAITWSGNRWITGKRRQASTALPGRNRRILAQIERLLHSIRGKPQRQFTPSQSMRLAQQLNHFGRRQRPNRQARQRTTTRVNASPNKKASRKVLEKNN